MPQEKGISCPRSVITIKFVLRAKATLYEFIGGKGTLSIVFWEVHEHLFDIVKRGWMEMELIMVAVHKALLLKEVISGANNSFVGVL